MAGETHDEGNGWKEYRRLVVAELERLSKLITTVDDKISKLRGEDIADIKVDIAMLQVKAGIWGAVAGLAVAISAVVLRVFFGHT
jgi:hypothetical protein